MIVFIYSFAYNARINAGVVKLVDALDSKSSGPCARVGSIPTSGTRNLSQLIDEVNNFDQLAFFISRLFETAVYFGIHVSNKKPGRPRRKGTSITALILVSLNLTTGYSINCFI